MKKYAIFSVILILITFLTLNSIISDNTINALRDIVNDINVGYICILFLIVILYFVLQGIYMKIILKSLNTKISIFKGIFYAMVEFYFSGITPSSTGGQPIQLYYMSKDKIPTTRSTITLILNTIYFKVIIVLLALGVLLFNNSFIFGKSAFYTAFFFIGLFFDLLLTFFWLSMLFNKKLISAILKRIFKVLGKVKFIKFYLDKFDLNELISNYSGQAAYIKKYPKKVIITFIITFIQRLLFFSIAYFVYRGLGYNNMSYLDLLAIQISVQMTVEFFPIPGGTIMSENMLKDAFSMLFGIGIAEVGMLFTRTFAFYIPLILSFIIIVIVTIKDNKKYVG